MPDAPRSALKGFLLVLICLSRSDLVFGQALHTQGRCEIPVVSAHGDQKKMFAELLRVIEQETGERLSSPELAGRFIAAIGELDDRGPVCLARSLQGVQCQLTAAAIEGRVGTTVESFNLSTRPQKLVSKLTRFLVKHASDKDHSRRAVWFLWFSSAIACTQSPHNHYVYADQMAAEAVVRKGKLFSPGFTLTETETGWRVHSVFDPDLGDQGLEEGIQVLSIDGQDPADLHPDLWRALNPFKYTVEAGLPSGASVIKGRAVPTRLKTLLWARLGDLVYLRLIRFSSDSLLEFRRLARQLEAESIGGLIVDLRGNGGGVASLALVDCFLRPGQTVSTYRELNMEVQDVSATIEYIDLPMVLLVDRGSASMSEVFAAAIRRAGRGPILGESTFGKGVGQQMFPIGDEGEVWLVRTEYFYPGTQRSWHNEGLTPDIEILIDDETRERISRYLGAAQILIKQQLQADPVLGRAVQILREGT